jgi:LytS/YehU family sensor histidine kinase
MDELESLGLSFSLSSIIAGLLFGVIGLYAFRWGRKRNNNKVYMTGMVMMVYPMFVHGDKLTWSIGLALSGVLYHYWWA